jgi:hypothetical protein
MTLISNCKKLTENLECVLNIIINYYFSKLVCVYNKYSIPHTSLENKDIIMISNVNTKINQNIDIYKQLDNFVDNDEFKTLLDTFNCKYIDGAKITYKYEPIIKEPDSVVQKKKHIDLTEKPYVKSNDEDNNVTIKHFLLYTRTRFGYPKTIDSNYHETKLESCYNDEFFDTV